MKKVIGWLGKYRDWLIAAVVLPLSTVGYDTLERTHFYDVITGTTNLHSALEMLYSSDPGLQNGLFASASTTSKEFKSVAKLVNAYGSTPDNLKPTFILRMAIKNAPYIDAPTTLDDTPRYVHGSESKRLILGTDFSPAILGFCPDLSPESVDFPMCQVRDLGNKYQLELQIQHRKDSFRVEFNLLVALLGILFSISRLQKKDKE